MGNEKNINPRDKKSSKGEEKNYDFIRETIKNRPLDKKDFYIELEPWQAPELSLG